MIKLDGENLLNYSCKEMPYHNGSMVLLAIKKFWNDHKTLPTYSNLIGTGIVKSKSTVHRAYKKLEKSGVVEKMGDQWIIKQEKFFTN